MKKFLKWIAGDYYTYRSILYKYEISKEFKFVTFSVVSENSYDFEEFYDLKTNITMD